MSDLVECPRCYAMTSAEHLAEHIDWHAGVRDGFHEFYEMGLTQKGGPDAGKPMCGASQRLGWDTIRCGLPPEHWYHQPLPEAEGREAG